MFRESGTKEHSFILLCNHYVKIERCGENRNYLHGDEIPVLTNSTFLVFYQEHLGNHCTYFPIQWQTKGYFLCYIQK